MGVRSWLALIFVLGCFEHHVLEDRPTRRDAATVDAADPDDAGICLCASDLDCPIVEECVEYVCEDCLCQPRMVPGCGECMCVTDADCPPPPPFGDCVRTRCADDCTCTFVADSSICGPDAFCDADTFLCTPLVEVLVLVRSDFEPVAEFDLITISTDSENLEYRPSPDDPFLSMGVVVATLRARAGTELFIAIDMWRGEMRFASRELILVVEEGAIAAFTIAR